jgi:RNA polymerase II subunit A-like phosphatase
MSDDLTPLSLPTTLPYPITLTRLHARPSQSITRGSPLISYTFTSSTNRRELARLEKGLQPSEGVRREDVKGGDMSAVWECGLEGEFVRWEQGIEVGRVVERKHASCVLRDSNYMLLVLMCRKPVLWLRQPCTHPVQLHGLCGICGADLTSYADCTPLGVG